VVTHFSDVAFIADADPDEVERNGREYLRLAALYADGATEVDAASRRVVWTGAAQQQFRRRADEARSLVQQLVAPLRSAGAAVEDYADALRDAQGSVAAGRAAAAQLDEVMASIGAHAVTRAAQAAEPMRRWEDVRATTGFLDWLAELGLDVGSIRQQADGLWRTAGALFGDAAQLEASARDDCLQALRRAKVDLPDFSGPVCWATDPADGFEPLSTEAGAAAHDPATALPGDPRKPDRVPTDQAGQDVSPGLQRLLGNAARTAYMDGPALGTPYFGSEVGADVDRSAWVSANSDVIQRAAAQYGIPADLLAGIAWIEVGGKGQVFDDAAGTVRQLAQSPWFPVDPEHLPGRLAGGVDETSYGPLSIQVRRAAEVLGYDPQHLTGGQRDQLVGALKDPTANVYIAAAYLRQVSDESSAAYVPAAGWTPQMYSEVASRYNGGPNWQSPGAQNYGKDFAGIAPEAKAALQAGS